MIFTRGNSNNFFLPLGWLMDSLKSNAAQYGNVVAMETVDQSFSD